MRIFGDNTPPKFKTYVQEPGFIFGSNDALIADEGKMRRLTFSFFGNTDETWTTQPKLYLHISNSNWSLFTGKLREYCLPWRWQAVYLEPEKGEAPQRILICTSVYDGELSNRLNKLVGQSLFVANLIKIKRYDEIMDQEFILVPKRKQQNITIYHPLGEYFGMSSRSGFDKCCHIYRIRGLFSLIKYYLLRHFSQEWEEVDLKIANVSETVLIKKNDRNAISKVVSIA